MEDDFEPLLLVNSDNKLIVSGSPRLLVVGVTEVDNDYHFTVEIDLSDY